MDTHRACKATSSVAVVRGFALRQIEVGADAAYATAVEFGARYSQAKPYLDPAFQAYLPSLERVLLEALDSAKVEAQL